MSKKINLNSIFTVGFILALTIAVALNLDSNPFSEVLPQHDSSMFTYFGYAMEHGKVMYTEIFDHKGPMIFIFNYLGALLTNPFVNGIFIIEISMVLLYFMIAFKIARFWLNRPWSLIQLIPQALIMPYYFTGGNLTEIYALPFIAYGLLTFVYFVYDKLKPRHLILSGISFSIVFLLRPNMIVVWIVFWGILLLNTLLQKTFKKLLIEIGYFIIGILIIFVPILLYLLINNALEAAIFQSFTLNFMYVETSENKLDGILTLLQMIQNDHFVIILSLFFIAIIFKFKRFSAKERLFFSGIVLFFILSVILSSLSGRVYRHYLIILIPTLIVPLTYLFSLIPQTRLKRTLPIIVTILIGLAYYTQLETTYNYAYRRNVSTYLANESNENYGWMKNIENENEEHKKVATIIKQNTDSDDEIYVHRQSGLLYLLSDRIASIKYFNLPSINIDENRIVGEDFLSDIVNAETEIIVLGKNYNYAGDKGEIGNQFFDFVEENFSILYEDHRYVLYKFNN